jgi:DNA-binding HxlR family transcriptional regulator
VIRVDDLPGRPCSIAAALEVVGDRWSLLAVREVALGNHRFTEILRNTGAPRDRLTARLKALVGAGVLEQRQYQDAPVRSDYHLTHSGRDLLAVNDALMRWGDSWASDRQPVELRHHDHPLHTHVVCDECGERVRRADVERVEA